MAYHDDSDPLENALKEFRQKLTDKQRQDFQSCTLQDVEKAIKDVERAQAAKRNQRNMQRISKFVEGMNQLGQVIEVFLNVHQAVAFLWAPIKFVLLIAGTWSDSLDCLLDTYSEIGDILPSLTQYRTFLMQYPPIRRHLENYYQDVLEFHLRALQVFSRPHWKTVFHSAWKTFRSQFGDVLIKLKRHRDLLSDEKLTTAVLEVQKLGQSVGSVEDKLDHISRRLAALQLSADKDTVIRLKRDLDEKRKFVFSELDPPDYESDLDKAWKERQSGSAGDWIFENETFKQWAQSTNNPEVLTLYLNGIPGTGKTVLVGRITKHFQDMQLQEQSMKVVFFFFKHANPAKSTITALLTSIISQLALQDEVVLDVIYERLVEVGHHRARSIGALQELAGLALMSQSSCFVLVDGLDKCGMAESHSKPEEAQRDVLNWIKSLRSTGQNQLLRVLVSGQRNGFLEVNIPHHYNIQLEKVNEHTADIKVYCELRTRDIQKKFSLSEDARLEIAARVCSEANGMFLYVKIVLSNLLGQRSIARFKRELKDENFPKGLERAYERVAVHVLEYADDEQKDTAVQILGLIICSERPLLCKEIQAFFYIDVANETADPEDQLLETCKHYCGSLVEVTEADGSIKFSDHSVDIVHKSARGYLLQTKRFNFHLGTLHAKMALFCSEYLSSKPFSLQEEDPNMAAHYLTGYYSLIDYAAAYWWKHFKGLMAVPKGGVSDAERNHSLQATYRLARILMNQDSPISNLGASNGETARTTISAEQHLQQLIDSDEPRDWEDVFHIEQHILPFRHFIEAKLTSDGAGTDEPNEPNDPRVLYGKATFKCTKPWCGFFQEGFSSAKARDEHIKQHNLPYRCTFDDCPGHLIGFSTESELAKHNGIVHCGNTTEHLHFPGSSGRTKGTIFQAVRRGDLATVEEFMDLGADINAPNRDGEHLLYLAAQSGQYDTCQYLLRNGALVNARCRSGETALSAAVSMGYLEIARLLLFHGANPNTREPTSNERILRPEIVTADRSLLAALPADFLSHQQCKFFECHIYSKSLQELDNIILQDDVERLKEILNLSCVDETATWFKFRPEKPSVLSIPHLNTAIRYKSNQIARYILESKDFDVLLLKWHTDAPADKSWPLVCACDALNGEIFLGLVAVYISIAKKSAPNHTLAEEAFQVAFVSLVERAKTAIDGNSPFLRSMVGELLQSGILNVKDALNTSGLLNIPTRTWERERTPLHHACRLFDDQSIIQLIYDEIGPSLELRDRVGFTPFHLAVKCGNIGACKALSQLRMPDLRNQLDDGETIIESAIATGNLQLLRWLLFKTGLGNVDSLAELRALHTAAYELNLDAIKLLIVITEDQVNATIPKVPERWRSLLRFDGFLDEHPTDTINILLTPLFLAMNSLYRRHGNQAFNNPEARAKQKATTCAEFRPIFDAIFQSGVVDLSRGISTLPVPLQEVVLLLIAHCCNADMVNQMACTGLTIPWEALFFYVTPDQSSRQLQLTLPNFPAGSTLRQSLDIELTETAEAFIASGRFCLYDLVAQNITLAAAMIDFGFLTRREAQMSEYERKKTVGLLRSSYSHIPEVVESIMRFIEIET
ncbi:hypothetical protein QBC43DRAFT_315446 [Cladorrhinum sp. PSN259]|nr:hypothetical protein QBC43DRAFT_315446 [Cladorrhinum sp. PSN259]